MFKWLYKPVRKIQPASETPTPIVEKEPTIIEKIIALPTVDQTCSDPVLNRSMVRLNSVSIEKLMEAAISGKDIQNHHFSAVALNVYFKDSGLPPSECFRRLFDMLPKNTRLPSKIQMDLEALYDEFCRLESL